MSITISDDSVILDAGIRLKFLRDAEYDPAPPLVALNGVEQLLLQCTPDGRLKVDSQFTLVGDVKVGAVEIEDRSGGSILRVDVVPVGAVSSNADNNHGFLSMGVDDSGFTRALPITNLGAGSFAVPSVGNSRYFWHDYSVDGDTAIGVNILFDFLVTKSDVMINTNKPISIKWDSISNTAIDLPKGQFTFKNQWASMVYITTSKVTKMQIYANG